MKTEDDFSIDSQMNSRRRGEYNNVASRLEAGKCVFCDLKEKYIITEKKESVLTVNIFPYIDGHLLVIPRRHVENYLDLQIKEVMRIQALVRLGVELLRRELGVDGIWILLRDGNNSGKTVRHVHWQVIPNPGEQLVKWNYQQLTMSPVQMAERLRR